jgi:hypothetical protein
VRGEGSKLGEPPQAYFAQMSFEQMSLHANVTQPNFVLIHHFNENESLDFELQNNNPGFRADVITTIV